MTHVWLINNTCPFPCLESSGLYIARPLLYFPLPQVFPAALPPAPPSLPPLPCPALLHHLLSLASSPRKGHCEQEYFVLQCP